MNHLRWKVYHCVYLVSPVSVVGESLEVDHKYLKVKKIWFLKFTNNIPQADSKDQTSLWLVGVFGS